MKRHQEVWLGALLRKNVRKAKRKKKSNGWVSYRKNRPIKARTRLKEFEPMAILEDDLV
jgi:hypothetical protein